MDNLPLLQVQVPILRADPFISEIVVVNQGSVDGTADWLAEEPDLLVINKENDGAGKGRNAGLDRAGDFDYVLQLDGGMRPLLPDIGVMVDFLERRDDADVLGLAWHDLETDVSKAWRRWPYAEITDKMVYRYGCLSLTNYCLANRRAWDGLRFSEEGPFGEAGWGADDDEMAYQWKEADVWVFAIEGVKAYRRGSGSFRRLYRETGIWPNQYGSTYEQRCVMLMQEWPQMQPLHQWGEPWLTIVIGVGPGSDVDETAKLIKEAHARMHEWHLDGKWTHVPQPYSIVACVVDNPAFDAWAEPRRLRQNHGDTIVVGGEIVRRGPENEATWAGDFRVWHGDDPAGAVRETAHHWALVKTQEDLCALLRKWWTVQPQEAANVAPEVIKQQFCY
jgi:hypothetical protein